MPKNNNDSQRKPTGDQFSLSLKVETTDKRNRNVDAEEFFSTAEKWLNALKSFAKEKGKHVRWQIVGLKRSSALVEVRPVNVGSGIPEPRLAREWEQGLRQIEKAGTLPSEFTPTSLAALKDFVLSIPQNAVVSIGNGPTSERHNLTPMTQYRIEQAAREFPQVRAEEYEAQGSVRGILALLDSWKPEDRYFLLKLPMEPSRRVKCTYKDPKLTHELGESFEGTVEISGKLKYQRTQPWPFAVEVDSIRRLPEKARISLKDLVGIAALPHGQNSVSYVRSLRDAE